MSDVVHYSEMWRTACGLKDWDFGSMDWKHVTCPNCLRAKIEKLEARIGELVSEITEMNSLSEGGVE